MDLLFNVAGVLGDGKSTPGPERSLRAMNREWLRRSLEVNTIGPLMLVAALTPLLESPAKKGDGAARPPSVVVNFSARVGSIGDNGTGGWYSYRMSKVGVWLGWVVLRCWYTVVSVIGVGGACWHGGVAGAGGVPSCKEAILDLQHQYQCFLKGHAGHVSAVLTARPC